MQRCAGKMHELGLYMYRCWILYCTCDIRIYVSNVYMYMCTHECLLWGGYTSSTAQGGGGSFKNRKPIGEVGCRKSRMAERINWWTERWLECRTIYLPIYLSIHPFVCLSAYLSIYRFLSPCIYLSTNPSSCLSSYLLSVYLPIHLFVFPSICLALYLSMQPCINQVACLCRSVYLSFFLFFRFILFRDLSISLSICLSFHLSFGLWIYLVVYLPIQLPIQSISAPKHFTRIYLGLVLHLSISVAQKPNNLNKTGFSCGVTSKTS